MGISDRLRRLDDGADKWARRYGVGLTGPPESAGKARRVAIAGAAAVAAVVGVARIAAGDPPIPVLLGTLLLVAVVAATLREGTSEGARQARAKRQVRLCSAVLMVVAVYLAVEEEWVVAGLLAFLVVFFNAGVWGIERHLRANQR